jgi:exopolysaccharide biosynthesis protein
VTSNGVVTNSAGKTLANISAVNFYKSSYDSGVVYFNDEYAGTTPAGSATVVLNSSSVVTRVSDSGFSTSVAAGNQVLQFYGSSSSKAATFTAGMKVSVKRTFASTSKVTYQTVFGAGRLIINGGVVTASCAGNSDTIRPRTALAWDSFGNVYLATTTMGRDWADGGAGGYRVGGSTVHQIADWLRMLGATYAVSLDGGGSTTMLAMLSGSYHRVDLPDGVWTRWIPAGLAITNR